MAALSTGLSFMAGGGGGGSGLCLSGGGGGLRVRSLGTKNCPKNVPHHKISFPPLQTLLEGREDGSGRGGGGAPLPEGKSEQSPGGEDWTTANRQWPIAKGREREQVTRTIFVHFISVWPFCEDAVELPVKESVRVVFLRPLPTLCAAGNESAGKSALRRSGGTPACTWADACADGIRCTRQTECRCADSVGPCEANCNGRRCGPAVHGKFCEARPQRLPEPKDSPQCTSQ